MMQPRTKRQKEVFDYIIQYIENYGHNPSYQQVARHLKLSSKAGIAKHIKALETQGLITRIRENGNFNLELRPPNLVEEAVCEIEWLNSARADSFVEDWEKEMLFVPKFLLGHLSPGNMRAFRAPNDSMLEENICEGDVVLLEKRSFARDGDIVAALTENKRTVLKKFFRVGAKIELRPANQNYMPILLPADKVSVLGIFRSLLRPAD
jgi:repressor LexA